MRPTMISTIDSVWTGLARDGKRPVHIGLAAGYPLDLYAQLDAHDRPGLLALANERPAAPPAYAAFDFVVGLREDGRWALSMSLRQSSLRVQFAALCDRVVRSGLDSRTGDDACAFLLHQVARWHRMLALGAAGMLSEEQQRGLIGEIAVLEATVARFGAHAATTGWVGPDDAPQDFVLPSLRIEVKTIISGTPRIKISSLLQLDIPDDSLCLAVVELVQCPVGTGGVSLRSSVEAMRVLLQDDVGAMERFEDRLSIACYEDREEYGRVEYRVSKTRWFHVTGNFPKLARSLTPLPIADAKYELLVSAIGSHEINPFNEYG
jgi:Putative  PD-(D/E)XK family member, (DUF4420)